MDFNFLSVVNQLGHILPLAKTVNIYDFPLGSKVIQTEGIAHRASHTGIHSPKRRVYYLCYTRVVLFKRSNGFRSIN